MSRLNIILLIIIAAIAATASSALFIVNETQQALVIQFGEPKRTVDQPGLKFKLPFIQDVIFFEKRVLSFIPDEGEEAILKDQKRLKVDTYARFKIVDPLRFYQSVRNEIEARKQLDTIVDSALREELGLRGLKEILSEQRNSITKNIRDQVNIKARTLGMEIIDIQIRRADYPEVTSQAIFARMISERERIAREFRATGEEEAQKIRASAEKQRVVTVADGARQSQEIRGAGDAEAIRIYAESFGQDPEFFSFYRSMEAYKKSFNQDDTMVINPTGDFFKFFELPSN
jgi:membrane protease subunit HflC|tara:strand:+ start:1008 stop:1871 length:864 start_codon:yes stop_codon:yes gene_type:complete